MRIIDGIALMGIVYMTVFNPKVYYFDWFFVCSVLTNLKPIISTKNLIGLELWMMNLINGIVLQSLVIYEILVSVTRIGFEDL